MIRFGVSDSMVVPVLLPGVTLCAGLVAAIPIWKPNLPYSLWGDLSILIQQTGGPSSGPALATAIGAIVLALYAACIFLGIVIAIFSGYVEYFLLDSIQSWRLNLNKKSDYWEQWLRYLRAAIQWGLAGQHIAHFPAT